MRTLVPSESVADRRPVAGGVRGTEQLVVGDEVDFGLGTDEEAALGIDLDAGAEGSHEVFVARVIGIVAIAALGTVDTGVHRADAGRQLQVGVAGEFGRVNPAEVQEEWTIRDVDGESGETALVCLPIDFAPDADIVPEEHVAAKAGIGATTDRWASKVGRGRGHRADAESQIDFLSL